MLSADVKVKLECITSRGEVILSANQEHVFLGDIVGEVERVTGVEGDVEYITGVVCDVWGVTEVVGDGDGVRDIVPNVVVDGEGVRKMFNNIFSSSSRSLFSQSKENVVKLSNIIHLLIYNY